MIINNVKKDQHSSALTAKMHSELFGCEIDVVLYGKGDKSDEFMAYAERCAKYFNDMPNSLVECLKEYSLRYYNDMKRYCDEDSPDFPFGVNRQNIWDYAQARCLIVEAPKDAEKIAFGVELGCRWEPEHGMEWTINDGRILYVGDYIGVSPWYDERVYEKECMSYVQEDFTIG